MTRTNHLLDYNQKDFEQNPGKYRIFKTAVLKNNIFNEGGGVDAGTVVGLEHLGDVRNQLYRCTMPIYKLSTGDTVYGVNLREFCL